MIYYLVRMSERGTAVSSFLTKKNMIRFLSVLILIVALIFILPVSGPIILALLTALALSPLVRLLNEKAKWRRSIAVTVVFILFLISLGIAGYLIITQVVTQAILFVENLPGYIAEVNRSWNDMQISIENTYERMNLPPDVINEINAQVTDMLNNFRDIFTDGRFLNTVTGIVASIPGYLVSFIVYLIALFLFMMDLPRLSRKMYSFMKVETAQKVHFMTSRLGKVIIGFFKAQFLVSLIIVIVTYIGLYFIVPEVALVMALIIWVVDFIPIIGSIAILAPWAIFQYLSGDVVLGTQLLVLGIILLIIRRTVEPKVMGHHIGLSPLATLISLYIGLSLLGVIGFIVGPLAVIAFSSAREAGLIKLDFKI